MIKRNYSPMVSGDKEDVTVLLAGLVDDPDGFVRGGNTLDGGLVDTRVADHVWGREVVHEELELVLSNALGHLVGDAAGAHLGVQVVRGDLGRGDELALLVLELLLDTAVEEEGDVRVLLRLRDVALLEALLAEPLRQHVAHVLRREGDREGVVGLVLGHGGDVDVLGVGEVGLGGAVVVAQQLGDFTHTVRPVVEEEEGVAVWDNGSVN